MNGEIVTITGGEQNGPLGPHLNKQLRDRNERST